MGAYRTAEIALPPDRTTFQEEQLPEAAVPPESTEPPRHAETLSVLVVRRFLWSAVFMTPIAVGAFERRTDSARPGCDNVVVHEAKPVHPRLDREDILVSRAPSAAELRSPGGISYERAECLG